MKQRWIATGVAIALCAAQAAFAFSMRGYVVANGGVSAMPSSNGVYRLYGTAGHPAGYSQNPAFRLCSGFWCFGGSRVVDVPRPDELPTEFALGPAQPNPARNQARFRLSLPKRAQVSLSAFDVGGRQLGEAVSTTMEAGEHDLTWRPAHATAGVFFVVVSVDGAVKARRSIVMVK